LPSLCVAVGGRQRPALDQTAPVRFKLAVHLVGNLAGFEAATILGYRDVGRMLDDAALIEVGKRQRRTPDEVPVTVRCVR
jgi:hypothetical protein